jgi:hypothetical protein
VRGASSTPVPSRIVVVVVDDDAATKARHPRGSAIGRVRREFDLPDLCARLGRDVLGHVERLETQVVGPCPVVD